MYTASSLRRCFTINTKACKLDQDGLLLSIMNMNTDELNYE